MKSASPVYMSVSLVFALEVKSLLREEQMLQSTAMHCPGKSLSFFKFPLMSLTTELVSTGDGHCLCFPN